ncbi:DEAD/DEAH box helicase [Candidatus Woesearchaeota archaeon]|nr:DEAD/DEAH box helicase [Candidatus Woesearchaeota archaeon]
MRIQQLKPDLHPKFYEVLEKQGFDELRPCQIKALSKGLLKHKNLLICSPTGSGKTLVAELAAVNTILNGEGKVVYIVPLKSLATEKFKEFKQKYGHLFRIALSIGDLDSADPYLIDYDLIITTSEKLDSLIRHKAAWLRRVRVLIVDEIHLLNDPGRGPTLEILITIIRQLLKNIQILGLSATIGNPKELADWLGAEFIFDAWRPVELHKGIYLDGVVDF